MKLWHLIFILILSVHVVQGGFLDSDGDGVPNNQDRCPNSDPNPSDNHPVIVDIQGCSCEEKTCATGTVCDNSTGQASCITVQQFQKVALQRAASATLSECIKKTIHLTLDELEADYDYCDSHYDYAFEECPADGHGASDTTPSTCSNCLDLNTCKDNRHNLQLVQCYQHYGSEYTFCEYGCEEGVCVQLCVDPDNSPNYNEVQPQSPATKVNYPDAYERKTSSQGAATQTDFCPSTTQVAEKFCDGNTLTSKWLTCPTACVDGVCCDNTNDDPLDDCQSPCGELSSEVCQSCYGRGGLVNVHSVCWCQSAQHSLAEGQSCVSCVPLGGACYVDHIPNRPLATETVLDYQNGLWPIYTLSSSYSLVGIKSLTTSMNMAQRQALYQNQQYNRAVERIVFNIQGTSSLLLKITQSDRDIYAWESMYQDTPVLIELNYMGNNIQDELNPESGLLARYLQFFPSDWGVESCNDLDGNSPYTFNVTIGNNPSLETITIEDECSPEKIGPYEQVVEAICNGEYAETVNFDCHNGCSEGACSADITHDGIVDGDDYQAMRTTVNGGACPVSSDHCDFNNDNKITAVDMVTMDLAMENLYDFSGNNIVDLEDRQLVINAQLYNDLNYDLNHDDHVNAEDVTIITSVIEAIYGTEIPDDDCVDSDGGDDQKYVYGNVRKGASTSFDTCSTDKTAVKEWICVEGEKHQVGQSDNYYNGQCEIRCADNVCVLPTGNNPEISLISYREDGDTGKDYYRAGTLVTFVRGRQSGSNFDICVGNELTEWYVDDLGYKNSEQHTCANGCSRGACIPELIPTPTCTSNAECSSGEFCKKDSCGASSGVCALKQVACTGRMQQVCGCNGVTYNAACNADTAGVNIDHTGVCTVQPSLNCVPLGDFCYLNPIPERPVVSTQAHNFQTTYHDDAFVGQFSIVDITAISSTEHSTDPVVFKDWLSGAESSKEIRFIAVNSILQPVVIRHGTSFDDVFWISEYNGNPVQMRIEIRLLGDSEQLFSREMDPTSGLITNYLTQFPNKWIPYSNLLLGDCTGSEDRCIFFDSSHGGPSWWTQSCNGQSWVNDHACLDGCLSGVCTGTSTPSSSTIEVINGGFEDQFTHWDQRTPEARIVSGGTDGTGNSVKIENNGGGVTQLGVVPLGSEGKKVTCSGNCFAPPGYTCWMYLMSDRMEWGNAQAQTTKNGIGAWDKLTVTTTVPLGSNALGNLFVGKMGSGGALLWDDVECHEDTGVCTIDTDCLSNKYCKKDSCDASSGVCLTKPSSCDDPFSQLVCGCDGITYESPCDAEYHGQNLAHHVSCPAASQTNTCLLNSDCLSGEFCKKDSCDAVSGTCSLKQSACSASGEQVCGCDGQTYTEVCRADAAGVNIEHTGACATQSPTGCAHDSDCPSDKVCNPSGECVRCYSTDGSVSGNKNYNEKGTIHVSQCVSTSTSQCAFYSRRVEEDWCNDDKPFMQDILTAHPELQGTLREWYCGNGVEPGGDLLADNYVTCSNGCSNGACIVAASSSGGGSIGSTSGGSSSGRGSDPTPTPQEVTFFRCPNVEKSALCQDSCNGQISLSNSCVKKYGFPWMGNCINSDEHDCTEYTAQVYLCEQFSSGYCPSDCQAQLSRSDRCSYQVSPTCIQTNYHNCCPTNDGVTCAT